MSEGMIAVSWSEYQKHGCIKCGCDYCYSGNISGGGSTPLTCGECGEEFMVLADGLAQSRIGFGNDSGSAIYPKLQLHPRTEPWHKYVRPDIRPEGEGDFFNSRGVGYDLAGFVKSKEAGERIIQMFKDVLNKDISTWLDYRKNEPTWIQVKVQKEDVNLEMLHSLVKDDGIITINRIKKAIAS